jgi:hypothetical protein
VPSRRTVAALGLAALGLSACTTDGPDPTVGDVQGDCVARVRFAGVVYEPDNRLDGTAPRGRLVGHGALVDCSGKKIGDGVASRYRVKVFAVSGVSPRAAIITGPGDAHGIYVEEQLPHDQWPAGIRRP